MQNGYQYELGDKFPFQYQWKEVAIKKPAEKVPVSIDYGLPLLRAMTGGQVTPQRHSVELGTSMRRLSTHDKATTVQ